MTKSERQQLPFPEFGFVRTPQILAVLPISRAAWWNGVADGRYPKPVKLSPQVTVWRAEQIRELIAKVSSEGQT